MNSNQTQTSGKYNWAAIENFCRVVLPHLPTGKLKGANHCPRIRLSHIVANGVVPRLAAMIPHSHKETVSIYRGKGYDGPVQFVSADIARKLRFIAPAL